MKRVTVWLCLLQGVNRQKLARARLIVDDSGVLSSSDSFCPYTRAIVSVAPPAPKPTSTLMGRDGYCCAWEETVSATAIPSALIAWKSLLNEISFSKTYAHAVRTVEVQGRA